MHAVGGDALLRAHVPVGVAWLGRFMGDAQPPYGYLIGHLVHDASVGQLLLICPAISLFLLLKIQTSRTADTTDKFVEDLLPHNENTPADCGTLFFLSGPLTNQSFPLPAYTNVFLGRSSQLCQIVVNTADISRKHICLCYHAAQHTFVITDYSVNGTYNTEGERLIANTSIEVPDGSVFYIGNKQTSFRLSADGEVLP